MPASGTWYPLAAVWDDSSSTMLYMDGTQAATACSQRLARPSRIQATLRPLGAPLTASFWALVHLKPTRLQAN